MEPELLKSNLSLNVTESAASITSKSLYSPNPLAREAAATESGSACLWISVSVVSPVSLFRVLSSCQNDHYIGLYVGHIPKCVLEGPVAWANAAKHDPGA